MHRRKRPPGARELLHCADGRALLLRPIEAADAPQLQAAFNRLDRDQVRQRFLHTVKELGAETAERLCRLDPAREFALVLADPVEPGAAALWGVARAAIDADGYHAGFGIVIAPHLAGQGLGRRLLQRLIRWARLKDLTSMYGDTFEDNARMLRLARGLGFRREASAEGFGIVRLRLPLATASQPAPEGPDAA